MFRITLYYPGVSEIVGISLAEDVQREFPRRHPGSRSISCTYANKTLTLVVESEADHDGVRLSKDFADLMAVHLPQSSERVEIGSVLHIE